MERESKASTKIEKKQGILTRGLQKRATKLRASIGSLGEQLDAAMVELATFEKLRIAELEAIPARLDALRRELQQQESREEVLQARYKELVAARAEKA